MGAIGIVADKSRLWVVSYCHQPTRPLSLYLLLSLAVLVRTEIRETTHMSAPMRQFIPSPTNHDWHSGVCFLYYVIHRTAELHPDYLPP